MKTSILQYNNKNLISFLKSINEPSFKATQIYEGIYAQNKKSFQEFTTLSKSTRNILEENFSLRTLQKKDEIISSVDKTQKFLWQLADGNKIESVAIYDKDRVTFCISSQVGCALDCKFCATAKMGILRNLESNYIL